jgi:predicted permease
MPRLPHRLWPFGSRRDREIAEEIQTHLDMAARDYAERGESSEQARLSAVREFGNIGLVRQSTNEVWSWTRLEQLVQDARFGARILWHAPGLSVTAIVLIALVIGGNTTVYSLVHGMLTAPAKGVTAERLVCVGQVSPEAARIGPYGSYPNYLDLAGQTRTLTHLAAWGAERFTIGLDDGSYAAFGGTVSANYFDTFAVPIVHGRGFREEDEELATGGLVTVISDRLWRDRFQSSPAIVGQRIALNGTPAVIVGVAVKGFLGANLTPGEDLWVPITAWYEATQSTRVLFDRRASTLLMTGRLAPDATLAQAQAELSALAAHLQIAYPDENKDRRVRVFDYSVTALLPFAELAPSFLALFGVITLITLMVVSANVANLMLARAVVRQRETAVRQSLGASRGRILRMLLAEGLALSVVAWIAACAFAWSVSRLLVRLLPPARQGLLPELHPQWEVGVYAMVLALGATLAFSIAPALRTWRQQVLPWLKAGEQSVARGRSRLSSGLVIVQLAFSVLLLTSAGLAYRSLSLLETGDVGFDYEQMVVMTVRTGRSGNIQPNVDIPPEQRAAGFEVLERIRQRLRDVHDVAAVSYGRRAPGPYFPSVTPVERAGSSEPVPALRRTVGPDYLRVLGIVPLAGRDVTASDRQGGARVAVINQNLASALFGDHSPLGRTIFVGRQREPLEIVGVSPNASFDGPLHDPRPNFVFSAEQQTAGLATAEPHFFVRHRGTLEMIAPMLTKAVAAAAPGLPVVSLRTMAFQLESVTELERMLATLLAFFAGMSLLVAALGQYAVSMFNMRRRTRDFGVRMALGASATRIQRSVVGDALRLTLGGLMLGFAFSVAAAVAGQSFLLGITPTDPLTYAGVFAVLGLTSVIAAYVPAWQAGRVNVVDALRQE